jgi:transposase
MLAAEKHRLVKVLGDAVSDLHGVAARALIDYLLAGGTPEQALGHAERQQAPKEELLASPQSKLSAEHLFVAQMSSCHIAALETRLADLERHLIEGLKPQEVTSQLLLTIPGIDRVTNAGC